MRKRPMIEVGGKAENLKSEDQVVQSFEITMWRHVKLGALLLIILSFWSELPD